MNAQKNILTSMLVLALIVLLAGCYGDGPIAPSCEFVQGGVEGFSVPVFDDTGNITGFHVEKATVSGDLQGTSSADFDIESIDENGTFHLTGSHTFWDTDGQFLFRTSDEGLTTANGQIENHMTLVEGATGELMTEGTVDLQTGALTLDYEGEVCQ